MEPWRTPEIQRAHWRRQENNENAVTEIKGAESYKMEQEAKSV